MRHPNTNTTPTSASPAPASAAASPAAAPSRRRHVLLVGIDGARWSIASEAGVAPTLTRMAEEGRWWPMTMEVPTISAPGWASILTGTTHAEHGFRDNSCVGNRNWECPDFLAQAFYRNQQTRTFAAAGWPVLVDPHGLGPIIHPRLEQQYAGIHKVICRDGEIYGYVPTDRDIADITVAAVRGGGFDLGFMYVCDVDDVGHIHGLMGEEYRAAITRVDGHLERLAAEVTRRSELFDEDWLIVCATDHGHKDEGGHGGDSPEERESWVTVWSPRGAEALPEWPEAIAPHELAGLMVDACLGEGR